MQTTPDRRDDLTGDSSVLSCFPGRPEGSQRIRRDHLGLGTLHRRTSLREQAHEHLATATTMYRVMDMQFWLQKALRAR